MKVRIKPGWSARLSEDRFAVAGDVVEVPDDEGAALCGGDIAEPVADRDGGVETAVPAGDAEERDADPARVRAWAKENGVDVPSRGKIPADVLDQYKASGAGQ